MDDYADTAEVISECFQLLGCESHFVTCGRAAIERAATIEPHVAVIDLSLSDVDGFEVGRELRRRCGRRAYLVALTGRVRADDQASARDAGFDCLMVKPIGLADIRELISHLAALASWPILQP